MRSTQALRLTLLLAALLAAAPLAAGVDEWTRVGPSIGRACALAAAPSQPSTVYALVNGELYKSTNGGRTWAPLSNVAGGEFACALRVDPTAPGTLYHLGGNSLFKSTDGGATWQQITLPERGGSALALHPGRSGTIFLSSEDFIAGRSSILRSTDGGATWTVLPTLPADVEVLAVATGRPITVYAGTSSGGIFKSTNGGGSWAPANTGLDLAQGLRINAIAIEPGNPRTLLVSTSKGVFRSTDGGGSWVSSNQGLGSRLIHDIAFDPARPSTVHAGTDNGVFKSTDTGVSWSPANQGLAWHEVLRIQVLPAALLAGTFANGIYRSEDGAPSWAPSSRGITGGRIVNLEIDHPGSPQIGFAVDPRGGLHRHVQGQGWSLSLFPESSRRIGLLSPESRTPGGLAVDPLDPATVYAGLDEKIARSTDSGATWTVHSGITCVAVEWIEIDPRQPSTLYAGGRYSWSCFPPPAKLCLAWKSTDSGLTWSCLREGQRRQLQLFFDYPRVDAFAVVPQDSSLYAIVEGVVYRSADGGVSWPEVSRLPTRVFDLEVDPGNPSILYAAGGAGLFRSADRGRTWEPLRLDVPPRAAPNIVALTIDPTRTTTLYALRGEGHAYRSEDSGKTWTRLPRVPSGVEDVEIDPLDPSTLYVGTYRGVMALTQSGRR